MCVLEVFAHISNFARDKRFVSPFGFIDSMRIRKNKYPYISYLCALVSLIKPELTIYKSEDIDISWRYALKQSEYIIIRF